VLPFTHKFNFLVGYRKAGQRQFELDCDKSTEPKMKRDRGPEATINAQYFLLTQIQ